MSLSYFLIFLYCGFPASPASIFSVGWSLGRGGLEVFRNEEFPMRHYGFSAYLAISGQLVHVRTG